MSETFGQMLRRLRTGCPGFACGNQYAPSARHMGQAELARRVGCNNAYISRLERGLDANPSRPAVMAIADALGLDARGRDRLLFTAGLAPVVDWLARYEAVEPALDLIRASAAIEAHLSERRSA